LARSSPLDDRFSDLGHPRSGEPGGHHEAGDLVDAYDLREKQNYWDC
jgi:hypothetical protein